MKYLLLKFIFIAAVAALDRKNVTSISEKFLKLPEKYPIYAKYSSKSEKIQSPRIVGGEVADPEFYYYQAALFISTSTGQYFCGGSLIKNEWILTASHCVDDVTGTIEIVLGANNILVVEPEQQIRYSDANGVTLHPQYDSVNARHDVALVRFTEEVEYDERILTVPMVGLWQIDEDFTGEIGTVAGWGKISDGAPSITDVLRVVQTEIISNEECRGVYGDIITEDHVCASGAGGKGPCAGDNGSGMRILIRLAAVVSFGSSSGCESGAPSVYTLLTKHMAWIHETVDYWPEY